MMYENRVAVKKFGDTPQNLTWWQFYQITVDIFGDAAAGPKTWQRYFGGEDEENEPARDGEIHSTDNSGVGPDGDVPGNDAEPADEDGRGGEDNSGSGSGNGTDNIQPISADEADGGADGENGTEDEPVDQKGAVGDHGAVSETGAGKKEDDTDGEESGESDCQESAAGETAEPAGAEDQGERIAPAQKSAEILGGEALIEKEDDIEITEKSCITRKEYIDTLTAHGTAEYIGRCIRQLSEWERKDLDTNSFWEHWLLEEVDENGYKIMEDDSDAEHEN